MVKGTKKAKITSEVAKIAKKDASRDKGDDGCYLQLRSRRIERRAPSFAKRAKKNTCDHKEEDSDFQEKNVGINVENNDVKDGFDEEEGSFGENVLDVENEERITRESTPIHLIVSSGITRTPPSSNRATMNRNTINEMENEAPAMFRAVEIEHVFPKSADKKHIEEFIKRYNFDPVNDKPLEGRYEWVKIKP